MATAAAVVAVLTLTAGCTGKSAPPDAASPEEKTAALVAAGRSSYLTNCTACHNMDPHKVGSIGPAIAGSPLALVQKRVLEAGYPAGYKPKRQTHDMAPLPHLKGDLEAIHAFLNAP